MRIVEEIETPYNSIDVWETSTGYDFEVSGGTHATYDRYRLLTGYAWDAITAATMMRIPYPSSILMLGLGGGTAVRQIRHFLPTCSITAIEIDEQMVTLARRYMDIDSLDVNIVVDDAYEYIKHDPERYDTVIDDVYIGLSSGVVRPISYSYELVDALIDRLTPSGTLVTNVITGHGYSKSHKNIRDVYANTFNHVLGIKPPLGFNTSYVGGSALRQPHHLKDLLYTFDHPSDTSEWEQLKVKRIQTT